jgi:hypothetical protein
MLDLSSPRGHDFLQCPGGHEFKQDYTPIGVYIGPESGCSRLKLLFRRLVVCEGKELPEKLGSLLQSLA